jgi:hypothetical protein
MANEFKVKNGVKFQDNTIQTTAAPSTTGVGASGTWGISVTGNAATATALQTARTIGGVSFNGTANINLPGVNTAGNQNTTGSAATLTTARAINGTNFNGSANITTANWGTARTVTIGNTGKSVNGSANVAWTLAEIGAYAATNPSGYTTNTGTVTSVGLTPGTGISVSGSPITGSGSITVTNTAPNVTTNITTTHNASTVVVNSSDGTNGTINAATTALAGVMTGTDKTKLDSVAPNVKLTVATAAATAAKTTTETVTFQEDVLYLVLFTLGNSVSSPTLNGINIRLSTTDASTTTFSLGANTLVPMYYNAATNVMQITGSYRTSDSVEDYNMRWENSVLAGQQITRYKLIMEGVDGRFYPLTIGDTTATNKTVSTQEFRLDGTILMYNTTATIAENAVFSNVWTSEYSSGTIHYTFNQSSGFQAYKQVYLVGTINSSGNFVLDNSSFTSWLTQTLPTTDDGKVYIYLGITNNTTTAFRLDIAHGIYHYKDGALRKYSGSADVLSTARTIGGVSFNGSANINLPGVNTAGNQSTTGNAATATTLQTARTIGGVSFNGSANINLPGVNAVGNQNTTGSAATLTTGRTIALTGDVSYTSGAFNGSANVTGTATLASVGTAGTYTKVTTDAKGRVTSGTTLAAADIPNLDAAKITSGIIDAARLPSYVDDVLEFANLAGFPTTGETGKLYVALDTNKVYRWSGTTYIFITSGAVDSVAGKTGVVTLVKADVGLGSVDNTSDAAKPVSTAQQTALNLKANIASPVFTGNVTGLGVATGTSFNAITGLATVAPLVAGTAAVGTSTLAARQDHVHPLQTTVSGNAGSATVLQTARTIGGVSFNGSANINLPGVNTAGNQNTTGTAANVTGTVAVANGGTGATTAAAALTNLGLTTFGSQLVGIDVASGGGNRFLVVAGTGVPAISDATTTRTALSAAATNQTMHIGTTAVAIDRASAALSLTGVSVDGSAGTLATARTFTVGNTGKTFNGSANVAWTLAEIGAYAATNPSGYTSNTGTVTSVSGTGGYGGLTLTGTVTSSGSLTLGGTPTGTWPISVSGASASTTGNAATATVLQTARTINGVSFNGSANITVADGTKLPLTGGTISGNLTVTGDISSSSDERIKTNWRSLPENFLESLSKVKHGIYDRVDNGLTQAGVSAQDMQKVLEQVVSEDSEGMLSVNYGNAALVAIIELTKRVLELEAKLNK